MLSALLALAPTLIAPLIKGVERIFGSKTGDTKLKAVMDALTPVLNQMATAGKLPGVPDTSSVTAAIESVLGELKSKGELDATATGPSGHQVIYIPPGARVVSIEFPKE